MENIFKIADLCLHRTDINEKLLLTHKASESLSNNELTFANQVPVQSIRRVSFPASPALISPRNLPKRKLNSLEGKAAFFHALAHIEFMAVYLAWDIIYRFRDLPQQFYLDWLQVADEEAQHFELLNDHLRHFGLHYGALPAHQGLWDHAVDTSENLLARLAIVPRCMEARGLDVTPVMIDRLAEINDEKGVEILTRIYQDEIGHVQLGSYWFKFFCKIKQLQPELCYHSMLKNYFNGWPKGPFNRETRIMAGFSNKEIDLLEQGIHE